MTRQLRAGERFGDAVLDATAWFLWKVARSCAILGTPLVIIGRWCVTNMLAAQRKKGLRVYGRYQ